MIKPLSGVFYWLDKLLYNIAKASYQVFYYISSATLVNGNAIQSIINRVYLILGIIMVFILAYNLLTYIINPDKISDKKAGAGAVVRDIIIALIVIVITPTLFVKLYAFQNVIITDGVISKLILGEEDAELGENTNRTYIEQGANSMIANVFSSFVVPKTTSTESNSFSVLDCDNNDGEYCTAYKHTAYDGDIDHFSSVVTNSSYTYYALFSTAAGLVITFFMLSFCLNMGIRVGKMAILQLIAPIPVILEIIPGKQGTRKAWIDELIKTYLEVFLYQAVVFLTIFLIRLIPGVVKTLFANSTGTDFLVQSLTMILLVFGLLAFGREAPKMIANLFGIKSSGTIGAAAKRAFAMGGVTGVALGSMATNAVRNFANAGEDAGIGKRFTSAAAGAFSAGTRNLWAGRNAHNWQDAVRNGQRVNATVQNNRRNRTEYWNQHTVDENGNRLTGAAALGAVMGAHVRDFGAGVAERAHNFVSEDYDASSARLKPLNDLTSIFDSTKIKPQADNAYTGYERDLSSFLSEKGINPQDFAEKSKAWIKANNSNMTGYLMTQAVQDGFGSITGGDESRKVVALTGAMSSREREMKYKKKDDLIMAVANARALARNNNEVGNLASSLKIDLDKMLTDLRSGNISNDEIVTIYDDFKKFNDAAKDRARDIKVANAEEERRRQSRGGNNGGNNGGNRH